MVAPVQPSIANQSQTKISEKDGKAEFMLENLAGSSDAASKNEVLKAILNPEEERKEEESKVKASLALSRKPAVLSANLRVNRASLDMPCFSIALRQRGQIDEILARFRKKPEVSRQSIEEASMSIQLPQN